MNESQKNSVPENRLKDRLSELPFELRSLAGAKNYQKWVFEMVAPFLGNRILELGAGIGNMSQWLPVRDLLVLTEYDQSLLALIQEQSISASDDPRVVTKQLDLMSDDLTWYHEQNLDTVVSFNVLEHIESDAKALQRLVEMLSQSQAKGLRRIVTFVPAHEWAFGSMDKTFGHFRRYSKARLKLLCAEVAPGAEVELRYFNMLGLFGWVVNGRIFKKPQIGDSSIKAFEALCPFVSKIENALTRWVSPTFGQSLLCVLTLPPSNR